MITVMYPAWNEADVIAGALRDLDVMVVSSGLPVRALLVDDGSTDATVAVATAAAAATQAPIPLTVLSHATNKGLGAGLRTGIYWALDNASDDDILVVLDADGTHPPSLIPGMIARITAGDDVVIASRYRPGATVTGVPFYRRILSDGGRFLFKVAFPIRGVRDYTCGFRAYRIAALRRARIAYGDELADARGFEASADLLIRLRTVGIKASEVPLQLDYTSRIGQSKMKVAKTIRATLRLIGRRLVDRFTRDTPADVQARLAAASEGSDVR